MILHDLTFCKMKKWEIEVVGLGLQYLPWDLAHVLAFEIIFDRYYCINLTKYLLSFGKNIALYFVIVWHSTKECTFYLNIGLPGPRTQSHSRWLPPPDSTYININILIFFIPQ